MSQFLTVLFALTLGASALIAADTAPAAEAVKPKPYTLDTCIVSGDKIGSMGDAIVVVRDGREIKFCCKGCIADFDKDPAKFLAKIAAAEKVKAAKADKP